MSQKHWIRGAGALLLLTIIAYGPVILRGGWIWDDDSYVTQNPTLKTAAGLGQIWANTATEYNHQYYPLVHSTFWIEYHLWELWPLPYHLDNVILQAINAMLVWFILRRLAVPGAWVIAAIFAVHPVHVESVAWVTERKNVLSGMFYLLAMLAYLKFAAVGEADFENEHSPQASRPYGRWGFYALSLLFFICALFGKSVTCSLPVILGLLLWWKKGKVSWRDILPLAPYLMVGLVLAWNTVRMEKTSVGAGGVEWAFSPIDRCLIAGRALWFYAEKLIWPSPLIFIYERWEVSDRIWWQYLFPLGWLAVLVGAWAARKRIGRGPLAALLFFSITLFPALGFVNIYPMKFSFVADHFQYLASLGIIILAVAPGIALFKRYPQSQRLGVAVVAGLLCACVTLCWPQGLVYQNLETLWTDTWTKNPTAGIACENLGVLLRDQGSYDQAFPLLLKGKELNPTWVPAYTNLGRLYASTGHVDKALAEYRQAYEKPAGRPEWEADLLLAYGDALETVGKADDALTLFQKAVALQPADFVAPTKVGLIYLSRKDLKRAEKFLARAIELRPSDVPAHVGMGQICMAQERFVEAQQHFMMAALLEPGNAEHSRNLASAKYKEQQAEKPAKLDQTPAPGP